VGGRLQINFQARTTRTAVQSLAFYLRYPRPRLRAIPPHIMPLVGASGERTFEHSAFMLYARDAKDVLEPNETQRNTLIVAGVYILVIGILWYVLSSSSM
jgi:hypothetical protein